MLSENYPYQLLIDDHSQVQELEDDSFRVNYKFEDLSRINKNLVQPKICMDLGGVITSMSEYKMWSSGDLYKQVETKDETGQSITIHFWSDPDPEFDIW